MNAAFFTSRLLLPIITSKSPESDLLALLEDEGYEAECDCKVKCEAGAVNTDCPVCRTDLKGCKGEEPEPTPTPTPAATTEPEDEGGFNAAAILPIVLILLLIAGAAAAFLKLRQKKPCLLYTSA